MTSEFPEGLGVGAGRFRLRRLLRGRPIDGLWLGDDLETGAEVWVTLRRAPHTRQRARKLNFVAPGVPAPLYIGPPDRRSAKSAAVHDAYVCVVDLVPRGQELAQTAPLGPHSGANLGVKLCELVASWASSFDGYVLRGLRPETIFVDEHEHAFVGAAPRPYFLLGNQNEFGAYPDLLFDPPVLGRYESCGGR